MRRAGELRLESPLLELPDGAPVVLATGGFQGDAELVRALHHARSALLVCARTRGAPATAFGSRSARGAETSAGLDEFYGRNMAAAPRALEPGDFVALAQVYARHARVENASGERFEPRHWAEIDVVQWTARQPGGTRLVRRPGRRARRAASASARSASSIEAARAAGAPVERLDGAVGVRSRPASRRPSAGSGSTSARGPPRALGRGRRRGRDLDGRLVERARGRPRARARRRRGRSRLGRPGGMRRAARRRGAAKGRPWRP